MARGPDAGTAPLRCQVRLHPLGGSSPSPGLLHTNKDRQAGQADNGEQA